MWLPALIPVKPGLNGLKAGTPLQEDLITNNDLNQVVTSSGFSENKRLGLGGVLTTSFLEPWERGWGAQSRGLIKPDLAHSY